MPTQAVQARQPEAQDAADLSGPRDPRHRPQDRGQQRAQAAFAKLLALVRRVREQQQRQRVPKIYSLHAPEVECIGKGKAHRPYEFGVGSTRGDQFVTHVKALPGNPYDGHTLATVEALIGNIIARLLVDEGYRGRNATPDYKTGSSSPARSEG